jgi:predicted dehydrogenase
MVGTRFPGMSDVLRIGTLGAARITPMALIRPARSRSAVEVTAVAARDRARAERFAAKHRIPHVLGSYEELVTSPEVDAVYNPLPNSHHREWTLRAIEAGKHVLCEKPFTSNAAEAREVADAARARPEVVVMEAFHWRYHPMAGRILEIVADGEIGELTEVTATMCIPLLRVGDIRWQHDLAGGAMMDVGCYTVSMLRHLSGVEPVVRSATALLRSPGVDRRIDATFDLPGGATGRITASMLSRSPLWVQARLVGTKGSISALNPVVPQLASRLTVRTAAGRRREPVDRKATSYGNQLDAFAGAITEGTPVPTGPEDAVRNMQVIDDVYRAAGLEPRPTLP